MTTQKHSSVISSVEFENGPMDIVSVGTVTLDSVFHPHDSAFTGSASNESKRTGDWTDEIGGAPANILRQLRQSRSENRTSLIPIIGEGPMGAVVCQKLTDEFDRIQPVFAGSVRRSCIENGEIRCNRPTLNLKELPKRVHPRIEHADLLFVGPFTPADNGMVSHALSLNKNSVLQLSSAQLLDRHCLELIHSASLCAMNKSEFDSLTGATGAVESKMYELFRQTGTSLLVSDVERVDLLLEGRLYTQSCFKPSRVVRTAGAGDVLLATVAEGLAENIGVEKSLYLGVAAACRHVSGEVPMTRGRLTKWGETLQYSGAPTDIAEIA